jgi:hypothetical protein
MCAPLGACMVMPRLLSPAFLRGSDSVGGKDFIDGLANLNLPIAADPELCDVLFGKSFHFSYRIKIDDDWLATRAR